MGPLSCPTAQRRAPESLKKREETTNMTNFWGVCQIRAPLAAPLKVVIMFGHLAAHKFIDVGTVAHPEMWGREALALKDA